MSETNNAEDVRAMPDILRQNLSEMQVRTGAGALVATFAQQIDYAKYMSRGREAIPGHLRENIGACLAVVDIATRFGFSPYMVASKTYVQADRLCFESVLVHAMIEQSGALQKRLRYEHSGEGKLRKVKVIGLVKGETEPFIYESRTIEELHPGHKEKDGKRYVLGSQLWDDKPDVQLIYNATYDWARINLPDVLMAMGVPPPDMPPEAEHRFVGPENAKDVTPRGLHERLGGAPAAGAEGAGPGHVDSELDNIAAGGAGEAGGEAAGGAQQEGVNHDEPTGGAPAGGKPRAKGKAKEPAKPKAKGKGAAAPPATPSDPPQTKPKTMPEWAPWARQQIDALTAGEDATSTALRQWWNGDRTLRNNLGITQAERMPVEALYLDALEKLTGAGK